MTHNESMREKGSECSLVEEQELLLLRFLDGECGFFERLKAQRLLKRSNSARSFLVEMQEIGDDARLLASDDAFTAQFGSVDLWDKISIRLEQEERAERFLGRRPAVQEERGRYAPASSLWMAGATGALASALLLTLVFKNTAVTSSDSFASTTGASRTLASSDVLDSNHELVNFQIGSALGNNNALGNNTTIRTYDGHMPSLPITTVSSTGSIGTSPSVATSQRVTAPIEVDWMRSDGSVRMLHDSLASAPVILVKKRNYTVSRGGSSRESSSASQGTTSRVPTATFVSK